MPLVFPVAMSSDRSTLIDYYSLTGVGFSGRYKVPVTIGADNTSIVVQGMTFNRMSDIDDDNQRTWDDLRDNKDVTAVYYTAENLCVNSDALAGPDDRSTIFFLKSSTQPTRTQAMLAMDRLAGLITARASHAR